MAAVQLSDEQFTQLLTRAGLGANAERNDRTSPSSKSVKPVRPTVDVETTESEWSMFEDNWARFKRMANLTAVPDVRDNLRQCCSTALNKRLFDLNSTATLNAASEEDLLGWIKDIAVKGVHKEVHRTQFVNIRQKQGEQLVGYLGRLKSEAALCDFRVRAPSTCADLNCTCANHGTQVSYQDDQVATQMVAGLYNTDHQAKVLSESVELTTLDSKVKRLALLEKSDASLSTLSGGGAGVNVLQGWKKQYPGSGGRRFPSSEKKFPSSEKKKKSWKKEPKEPPAVVPERSDLCQACNQKHPQCKSCGGSHKCTTRCNSCKGMGHIRNCCPSGFSSAQGAVVAPDEQASDDEEKAVTFNFSVVLENAPIDLDVPLPVSVSAVSSHTTTQDNAPPSDLDVSSPASVSAFFSHETQVDSFSLTTQLFAHMEFIEAEFRRAKPRNAPMIQVECELLVDIHRRFDIDIPQSDGCTEKSFSSRGIDALADTGAQVCTAGPDLLQSLGTTESVLITTNMTVKGLSQSSVTLLGAVFLEISSQGIRTKQIVYIAREARCLILSETALKGLGVLPPDFPKVGMFLDASHANVEVGSSKVRNKCGCLVRTEVPPLPEVIPFEPIAANLDKFENWLKNDYYASSAFNVCEHQVIPTISGPPLVIRHKNDVEPEPVAIHSPFPVAFKWKKPTKQGLDKDTALGVIGPVPANTPTTWCSRMLVIPKKDGTPRRVVDLQALNKVSVRETHHTPSPWQQVSRIPKNMKKSILDAWNGYHSVPLAPESRHKTTFITEWGRYWYLRAVQGYKASGDAYTKRFDDITVGFPDVTRIVDDSCLWKPTIAESFWHICRYITLCAKNGVIFNPKKLVFGRDALEFAGFTVTLDSLKPTERMIDSISNFPAPTSTKEVKSWFGLVNQVAYAFAHSHVMAPFRELLRKNCKFYWDSALSSIFEQSKREIVECVKDGVKMFSLARVTCLATDWSRIGIGFFLLQKYCDCTDMLKAPVCGPGHWKLVFAGSRFLRDPETRYAPIEGEALAVVFALEQSRVFVLGCDSDNLIVSTDHRPLVPILNSKRLDLIKNPRLLAFKESTLMYSFRAQHVKGALNLAADATSRNPDQNNGIKSTVHSVFLVSTTEAPAQALQQSIINSISAWDDDEVVTWDQVQGEASKDDICMTICDAIEKGFPLPKAEAPECIRPYYKVKEELYAVDGVPFLNGRMFVPKRLRNRVLTIIHSAHQGSDGMKRSVRDRYWWFGMDADINQTRNQCGDCNEMAPSNVKEPASAIREPEYPWQLAVVDYFDKLGHHYLVAADRFSGWPEIYRQDGKLLSLLRTCRSLFAHFGVPEEIASDGGPPFQGYEWFQFLKQWGIHWRLSSANFPQSNGRAELAVKSCKRLLEGNVDATGRLDTTKVTRALLQYRNTPITGTDMSPAYMLYGRQLKDALPYVPQGTPHVGRYGPIKKSWKDIQKQRELAHAKKQAKVVERYNRDKRPLTVLSVGDSVSIQNQRGSHPLRWDRTGVIVERLTNKQYLVKSDGSGRILLRTRAHLRKIDPVTRRRGVHDVGDDRVAEKVADSDDIGKSEPLHVPGQLQDGTKVLHPIDNGVNNLTDEGDPSTSVDLPLSPPAPVPVTRRRSQADTLTPSADAPLPTAPVLRRSDRQRRPRTVLSPRMDGKRHDEVELPPVSGV